MEKLLASLVIAAGLLLAAPTGAQAYELPDEIVIDTGIRCVTDPCPSSVRIPVPVG